MAIKRLSCPACSGPVNWSDIDRCYHCLICGLHLPNNLVGDNFENSDDLVITLEDDSTYSDDFLTELDSSSPNFCVDDSDYIEPIYTEQDLDKNEISLVATPKSTYKIKNFKPKKKEMNMARTSKKICCTLCGTDKTARGGKLQRLYGPKKNVCLKCYYANKEVLETENIEDIEEEILTAPHKISNEKFTHPTVQTKTLAEDLVLFDLNGNFVGRFSNVTSLAAAAAQTGQGVQAYRLNRVEITIRVEIEGCQII